MIKVKPKKYRARATVEAVQFFEDKVEELPPEYRWQVEEVYWGGNWHIKNGTVRYPLEDGDWLIKRSDGHIFSLTSRELNNRYELISATPEEEQAE